MSSITASHHSPVTAPHPGRRERRRAETRDRIFHAALRLAAEHGFTAITVEQITEAADVGKGTFFNYFRNKEDVLSALAEVQLDKYARAMEAVVTGAASPREALHELWIRLPEEPGRSQALIRSLMAVFLTSPAIREKFMEGLAEGRQILARLFALGQQKGEVRRDCASVELALAFQQKLLGTALVWTLHPPTPLKPWLEASFDKFWHGVGSSHSRTRKGRRS